MRAPASSIPGPRGFYLSFSWGVFLYDRVLNKHCGNGVGVVDEELALLSRLDDAVFPHPTHLPLRPAGQRANRRLTIFRETEIARG